MKQKKINIYNHDDCLHLYSILNMLHKVKIQLATQPFGLVRYDLKYNFCDICWSHLDHCECSRRNGRSHDWDDYNDR